jgi:leucyl aminopeptidase
LAKETRAHRRWALGCIRRGANRAKIRADRNKETAMEFSIKALGPEKKKTGCLVLGVWQGSELTRAAQLADKAGKGHISGALARGDLSGRTGTTLLLHSVPGIAAERVLLVGLGERKEFGETAYRDAIRATANALRSLGARDATLAFADVKVAGRALPWNVRHAVTGIR